MYFQRLESTIIALATAVGSTIGIIRISGENAFSLIKTVTHKQEFSPFKASLTTLFDSQNEAIDHAIVITFPAPNSYTGEDVVEVHVHGAALHAQKIVDYFITLGAEHAVGGEFSYRSIINGKRNLSDVSAIDELISTTSELALSYQRKELIHRNISSLLESLEREWFDLRALATAIIDFPEDVDIEIPKEKLEELLTRTKNSLTPIYQNSLKLREYQGLRVVIAGRPNAGKSTLFNKLLQQERAIVTNIPGTTRDFITEKISLDDHTVTLIDTAGIRESHDHVEKEGVLRAKNQIKGAHIVLHLIDSNIGWTEDDEDIKTNFSSNNTIYLLTKADMVTQPPKIPFPAISTSFITNIGFEKLLTSFNSLLSKLSPSSSLPATTSHWHLKLFELLLSHLSHFDKNSYNDVGLFYYHIQNVHDTLLSLLGKDMRDDIHEEIFSSFCIGK